MSAVAKIEINPNSRMPFQIRLNRLGALFAGKHLKAPLNRDALAGVFVVRAESCGVSTKSCIAFKVELLQGVDALPVDEVNLEMHSSSFLKRALRVR